METVEHFNPIGSSSEKTLAKMRRVTVAWLQKLWYAELSSPPLKPLFPFLLLGSKIYEIALKQDQSRMCSRKRALPAFVISVGNLTVGGTGKTPLTLWLARRLRQKGFRPAILSRGYGRKGEGASRVCTQGDIPMRVREFGDEPVLMARRADSSPVWVGRNRFASGMLAIRESGADVLILDDGFQHICLGRNLDVVLLDSLKPFGNGHLIPLGPLREPVAHLGRADAFIWTRADEIQETHDTRSMLQSLFPEKPVFSCRHRLTGFTAGLGGNPFPVNTLRNSRAVAFAGIARPDAFFRSLSEEGVVLSGCFPFPDHHQYNHFDSVEMLESTEQNRARFLITTEKDAVRLPLDMQPYVLVAQMELDFGLEEESFLRFLDKRLPQR